MCLSQTLLKICNQDLNFYEFYKTLQITLGQVEILSFSFPTSFATSFRIDFSCLLTIT